MEAEQEAGQERHPSWDAQPNPLSAFWTAWWTAGLLKKEIDRRGFPSPLKAAGTAAMGIHSTTSTTLTCSEHPARIT